jgi:hypothetical protein
MSIDITPTLLIPDCCVLVKKYTVIFETFLSALCKKPETLYLPLAGFHKYEVETKIWAEYPEAAGP